MHKYATAVERICKPMKMWQNICFKAVFSVCLATLIKIWEILDLRTN